jgi:hypothetical protein
MEHFLKKGKCPLSMKEGVIFRLLFLTLMGEKKKPEYYL